MTSAANDERLNQLRASPFFAEVGDDPLRRLAADAEPLRLRPGEALLREGDPAEELFVVVSGDLEIRKLSGNAEVALTRVGPGSIQGEMAAFERGRRMASVYAVTDAEVLRLPLESVLATIAADPDVATALLRTVTSRLRGIEEALRQREKLAALGTLAAGLAHELNNPAAAIRRSADELAEVTRERNAAALGITVGHPQLEALVGATPSAAGEALDPLARADRTDEVAAALRAVGFPESEGPDDAAGRLTSTGWTSDDLRRALAGLDPAAVPAAVRWLASVASGEELLSEIQMAAARISAIVGATKGYAYLDQAPVQRFAVTKGIDDTLVILEHKLEDIAVRRDYAAGPARDRGLGQRAEPGLDEHPRQRDRRHARPRRDHHPRRSGPMPAGSRSTSATTAPGSRRTSWPSSSSRSSRPSPLVSDPGWGCISATTSWSSTAARSRLTRDRGAPASPSRCRRRFPARSTGTGTPPADSAGGVRGRSGQQVKRARGGTR